MDLTVNASLKEVAIIIQTMLIAAAIRAITRSRRKDNPSVRGNQAKILVLRETIGICESGIHWAVVPQSEGEYYMDRVDGLAPYRQHALLITQSLQQHGCVYWK